MALAVGAEVSTVVVLSGVVELLEDSSFSPQEMMMRLKRDIRITCKIFFIFLLITVMKANKIECLIFIFWNQTLCVNNPELANVHKRLSNQSQIIAYFIPMSTICQVYYFIVGGI